MNKTDIKNIRKSLDEMNEELNTAEDIKKRLTTMRKYSNMPEEIAEIRRDVERFAYEVKLLRNCVKNDFEELLKGTEFEERRGEF